MAKSSVPKAGSAAQASPKACKATVTVVYRPLEYRDGSTDPANVKWNGIQFKANVPVELDPKNPAHHIVQLLPRTFPGQNGEALTKHVESKVFMGDMARDNPSFEVDGKRVKRKVSTRVVPPPGAEWTEAHEGRISESDEIDTSVAA
jgi:hypothetical protein